MTNSTQETGSEKPKSKKLGYPAVIAFFLIGIIAFVIIGVVTEGPKSSLVDTTFAPVIDALDKYKATNRRYPDKLDALLPAYLSALPSCPDSTKPGAAYFVDPKSGEYKLGCYTMLFTTRLYDSGAKRWETSD